MTETILKTKGVEAVDKALHILSLFYDGRPEAVARRDQPSQRLCEEHGPAAADIAQNAGLVVATPDKAYAIGPQAFRLGHLYQWNLRLEHVVRPVLRALVLRTGESGSFFRREGNMRVCLFRRIPRRCCASMCPRGEAGGPRQGSARPCAHGIHRH